MSWKLDRAKHRPPPPPERPGHWPSQVQVVALARPYCLPLLRLSLGVVFLWFGALKVAGVSPVTELVAGTVPWFDPSWFVPLLGIVESALGVALIGGWWSAAVGTLLAAHLAGTFLVMLMQPSVAFQHGNPLLLTTDGEFVLKNIVLLSAALMVAFGQHDRRPNDEAAARPVAPRIPAPRSGRADRGDGALNDNRRY